MELCGVVEFYGVPSLLNFAAFFFNATNAFSAQRSVDCAVACGWYVYGAQAADVLDRNCVSKVCCACVLQGMLSSSAAP